MSEILQLQFESSLTDLCSKNSSFDAGIMRVCYPGVNRNKSSISREDIERCIPTMYNCPVVCTYHRDSDTLGSHDVALVHDSEGNLKPINVTQPVGVIPESAKVWFADHTDDDGVTRPYLHAECLIWKRQEAYDKIKRDGISAQSMEISVKNGKVIDGIYHIYDFEFQAFTLLGVEPCYQGAALEVFSAQEFKEQMSAMMKDLKDSLTQFTSSKEVDDKQLNKFSTEGGEEILDETMVTVTEEPVVEEAAPVDETPAESEVIETDGAGADEPTETGAVEEEPAADEPEAEEPEEPASEDAPGTEEFSLSSGVIEEINRVLATQTVSHDWGECAQYWYVDCDLEAHTVYCYDTTDWLLYGFTYEADGDTITIDWDSKSRKKFDIVDFTGGEQTDSTGTALFTYVATQLTEAYQLRQDCEAQIAEFEAAKEELETLRQFKKDADTDQAKAERVAVFERFPELAGIEEFEALRESYGLEYSVDVLEEKCFAIRGKHNVTTETFSLEGGLPKYKVNKQDADASDEPYGGLFTKYGFDKE